MAEIHVISALVLKRSELLGEIKHYESLVKEYYNTELVPVLYEYEFISNLYMKKIQKPKP